jgi:hypothetical protein
MALIRSLLVRLGMESANFDAGAKRASNSLYGLTRATTNFSNNASMLMRAGIYGKIFEGAVSGITEMVKSAGEGENAITNLGRGLYSLTTTIPVIGRVAEGFKKLADEISGARVQADAMKIVGSYESKKESISGSIRSMYGPETNFEKHQKIVAEIFKNENTINSVVARRSKLEEDIAELSQMIKKEKLQEAADILEWWKGRKERQLSELPTGGTVLEQLDKANNAFIFAETHKGLEEISNGLEMFFQDMSTGNDTVDSLITAREMETKRIKDTYDALLPLSDALADFYGVAEDQAAHISVTAENAAMDYRENRIQKELSQYKLTKNPSAYQYNPEAISLAGLNVENKDIWVQKQDESIKIQNDMLTNLKQVAVNTSWWIN